MEKEKHLESTQGDSFSGTDGSQVSFKEPHQNGAQSSSSINIK